MKSPTVKANNKQRYAVPHATIQLCFQQIFYGNLFL